MDSPRRLVLDIPVAIFMLYAGVCIYELGNYIALSAVGSQASLVFSGVLPIGVSASISNSGLLVLAKPAQIGLSTLAMVGLFFLVRSKGLRASSYVGLTTISIYLASAYWELLPTLGGFSYETHLAIFSALAIGAQFGLSSRLEV